MEQTETPKPIRPTRQCLNELITDPYRHIPDEEKGRISTDVPQSVLRHLKAVCPHRGIMQAMVNHFLAAIVKDLKEKGIVSYDPTDDDCTEFVRVVRRRTIDFTPQQGPIQDVQGGVGPACEGTPNLAQVPHLAPSTPGVGEQKPTKGKGRKAGSKN